MIFSLLKGSCETALLRVHNDISDLSVSFDIIDHDNPFCIFEKYLGILGNALKLIKSYFSNRTQRVQIDAVLSDFTNIICGVPQGSVLGPLKLCLYLLPMSTILKYNKIGYLVVVVVYALTWPLLVGGGGGRV